MTSFSAPTAHPSMVLAAWVEPLVRGRRVAVFGEASAGLAERLAERGARQVHAWDRDSARVAEAVARSGGTRGPVIHALHAGDLGVRDGAFDVVVVGDLSLFAAPDEIIAQSRRLLGPSGVCVVASPNPEATRHLMPVHLGGGRPSSDPPPLGYYDLYDVVSADFSQVRMAGQAPFVGYTLADFAPDGEPEVSVDTSLLESSEEPEWFVALASERTVSLDAFAVIEVPFSDLDEPATRRAEPPRPAAPISVQPDPRQAEATRQLEAARSAAQAEVARVRSESEARITALSTRVAELESELAKQADRLRERAAEVGDRDTRLRELEASHAKGIGEARTRADRLALEVQELELELGRARERADSLEAAQTTTARSASVAAASVEERLAEMTREADQDRQTITMLTAQREDAAARVHELQLALDETDRARLDVSQRLAALEQDRDLLRKNLEARHAQELAAAREAQANDDRATVASTQMDLVTLEEQLRARGGAVAELQRQLAEAERIGRELVDELEDLRAGSSNGSHAPPGFGGGSATLGAMPVAFAEGDAGLRERLELLGRRAAESEANFVAASWRVSELEQRLADAQRGEAGLSVDAEIEQALVAAHSEIAALRRLVGGASIVPAEATPESSTRASTEDAVLLHQVSGELQAQAPARPPEHE